MAAIKSAVGSAGDGGVQSLERAFDLLERVADAGGEVGLSGLSASSGLPLPPICSWRRPTSRCFTPIRRPCWRTVRSTWSSWMAGAASC